MQSLCVLAAALLAAVVISAPANAARDDRKGGRKDRAGLRMSTGMLEGATSMLDRLFMLDARDAARKALGAEAAVMAADLRTSIGSVRRLGRKDGRARLDLSRDLHRRATDLASAVSELSHMPLSELDDLVSRHDTRVGSDPAGVAGERGTRAWLLGGLRARSLRVREGISEELVRHQDAAALRSVLGVMLNEMDSWEGAKALAAFRHVVPSLAGVTSIPRMLHSTQRGGGARDLTTVTGMYDEIVARANITGAI